MVCRRAVFVPSAARRCPTTRKRRLAHASAFTSRPHPAVYASSATLATAPFSSGSDVPLRGGRQAATVVASVGTVQSVAQATNDAITPTARSHSMGRPQRGGRREHLSCRTAIGLAALIRDKGGPCEARLPRRPPSASHPGKSLRDEEGCERAGMVSLHRQLLPSAGMVRSDRLNGRLVCRPQAESRGQVRVNPSTEEILQLDPRN